MSWTTLQLPKIFRARTQDNQQVAAELLVTPTALADLSAPDVRTVVEFI